MEGIYVINTKSGRLQGKLSGQMKESIIKIKKVINALVEKADSSGSPVIQI